MAGPNARRELRSAVRLRKAIDQQPGRPHTDAPVLNSQSQVDSTLWPTPSTLPFDFPVAGVDHDFSHGLLHGLVNLSLTRGFVQQILCRATGTYHLFLADIQQPAFVAPSPRVRFNEA